jgi:hypothetical protein
MAEVVDLRGRPSAPGPAQVLADPSGRRARMLARAGRAVAIVFVLWLGGLALAGLGILPAGDVPLGPVISAASPPKLTRLPAPKQPARADLVPAAPASRSGRVAVRVAAWAPIVASVRRVAVAPRHVSGRSTGHGHSRGRSPARPKTITSPKITTGPTVSTAPSAPPVAAAPGQTTKQTTPGHTHTVTRGSSAAAPGQVKQTTTVAATTTASPGKSGSAPGQTVPHGGGHGNNN